MHPCSVRPCDGDVENSVGATFVFRVVAVSLGPAALVGTSPRWGLPALAVFLSLRGPPRGCLAMCRLLPASIALSIKTGRNTMHALSTGFLGFFCGQATESSGLQGEVPGSSYE